MWRPSRGFGRGGRHCERSRTSRQAVRDCPHNIDASEPDNDEWRAHAEQCLEQAAAADILLLYVDPDDARPFWRSAPSRGGAGRQVFLVSRHPWPFLRHHQRCRSFNHLADAITAITAIQAGEEARTLALLTSERGRPA
jgi:hypothetical protein